VDIPPFFEQFQCVLGRIYTIPPFLEQFQRVLGRISTIPPFLEQFQRVLGHNDAIKQNKIFCYKKKTRD